MRRVMAVLRAAAVHYAQDACAFFAQAIAFNAMFAVFPLLILAFAAMGFVYVNAFVSQLAPSIQGPLLDNARHVIQFRGIWGAIALILLLWSGKNLFQTLAFSLDRALGIPKGRHALIQIMVEAITFPRSEERRVGKE